MARYIDADDLLDKLKELKEEWGFTFTADGVEKAMFQVGEQPTADVVPKSEVDILKSTITHKEDEAYNKGYEDAKADILEKFQAEILPDIERNELLAGYGDEFFEGRVNAFHIAIGVLDKLTEKYVEEAQ